MRGKIPPTLLALGSAVALAPVASATDFPPPNAGCGDDGLTQSQNRPTVRLTSATARLRDTGSARIFLRGNQTAAMTVKVAEVGGKRVGGTAPQSFTCATPNAGVVAVPINAYGRKLVRRHGRLAVKFTFRLVNRSGVTHTRVWSGVIKPG